MRRSTDEALSTAASTTASAASTAASMTLADLEIELTKRGATMSGPVRSQGEWRVLVFNAGLSGFGIDVELEAAVRLALADFDAEVARGFCRGEA